MKKNTIIYVVAGVVALIIIVLSICLAVSNNSNKSNNRYATKNIKIEKYNESGEVEKVVEIKKRKDINELLEICKNISLEQDETSKYLGIKTDVKIDLQNGMSKQVFLRIGGIICFWMFFKNLCNVIRCYSAVVTAL